MSTVWEQIKHYLSSMYLPKIQLLMFVKFLLLHSCSIFYGVDQRTRAYTLLKGILIVALFIIVASIFSR